MNLNAIGRGAMIIGGATLGGAVLGGGTGLVTSLKQEGVDNRYARQEGRDTVANAIIGAGLGAAAGVALLAGRGPATKLIPALGKVPLMTMPPALTLATGIGFGAAAGGVGSLAFHAFD